jgi:hypothetical protein
MKKTLNEVKKISSVLYKPFRALQKKQDALGDKYGDIDSQGFITIDDMEFNLSFAFDDCFISKKNNAVLIMNLFFVDIDTDKSKSFLRKNFPSYFKIDTLFNSLRDENDSGYIAIGKDVIIDEEIGLVFKTVKDFKKYAQKFSQLEPLYKKLLKEIEIYAKNQVFVEVSNTGIKEIHSNDGKSQEILLKSKKNVFKISILSESYEFQSYGKLYILSTDKKWTLLKKINPKKDYGIELAYKRSYSKNAFEPIINDLTKLAEQLNV